MSEAHDHSYGHHEHPVAVGEQHHGPSHEGTVVLEVGGEIGAIVVYVDEALAGAELQIQGLDPDSVHTHTLVRERIRPGGVMHAAVFVSLQQGSYAIGGDGHHDPEVVTVSGGRVTEVDWRAVAA